MTVPDNNILPKNPGLKDKSQDWKVLLALARQIREQESRPANKAGYILKAFAAPLRGRGPWIIFLGAISRSLLFALNPVTIFQAIKRIFLPYLLVFGLCAVSYLAMTVTTGMFESYRLNDLGGPSSWSSLGWSVLSLVVSFYALIVMGGMLGRLYFCEQEALFG